VELLKKGGAIVLVLLLIPLITLTLLSISIHPLLRTTTYVTVAQESGIYETIAQRFYQETQLTLTETEVKVALEPLLTHLGAYLTGETTELKTSFELPPEVYARTIQDLLTELPPCTQGEDLFTPELHCKPVEKTKEAFAREVISKKDSTLLDLEELSPGTSEALREARETIKTLQRGQIIIYALTGSFLMLLMLLTLPLQTMLGWISAPCVLGGIGAFGIRTLIGRVIQEETADLSFPGLTLLIQTLTTSFTTTLLIASIVSIGIGAGALIISRLLPSDDDKKK
jgi:hypothetical protein